MTHPWRCSWPNNEDICNLLHTVALLYLPHLHHLLLSLSGLLSHTMVGLDQASAHFEGALAFCREDYRPELGWTCCDYADTLSSSEPTYAKHPSKDHPTEGS